MKGKGSVTVSIWPLAVPAPRLAALHAVLSADERERVGRMRLEAVANDFIVGRGVARELLATECGCAPADIAFSTDGRGKPRLAHPASALAFNLSHSGGYCALATGTPGRLGVDIEALRPTVGDLAKSVFSHREAAKYATITLADQLRVFFRAWVAKEAYLKATGEGLGGGLTSLELDLSSGPEITPLAIRGDTAELSKWQFHGFDIGSTIVGAVAVENGDPAIDIKLRFFEA